MRLSELGMKEADLARRLGITQQVINNWKRRGQIPPARHQEISDALGVSIDWLLGRSDASLHAKLPPLQSQMAATVEPGPEVGAITMVPIVGNTQAGPDAEWFELGYPPGYGEDYVDVPAKDPHAYALRVVGGSMEPRMHEGEIVLVYPSWEAQPGDEVVVRMRDGESMVKRLVYVRNDRVGLDSIAADQPRIERRMADIEFMHPVVGVLRQTAVRRRASD